MIKFLKRRRQSGSEKTYNKEERKKRGERDKKGVSLTIEKVTKVKVINSGCVRCVCLCVCL